MSKIEKIDNEFVLVCLRYDENIESTIDFLIDKINELIKSNNKLQKEIAELRSKSHPQ